MLNQLRELFERLPDLLLKHRALVWIAFISITVFMAAGIGRIQVDTSMDAVFPKGHPVHDTYVEFRKQFGSDSGLSILYRAKDGDVFSEQSLSALQGIHNELIQYRDNYELRQNSPLSHIVLLTDLINVGYLQSQDSEVMVARNFIGKQLPVTDQERSALREQALNHPNYPGVFVNAESTYATINIGTDFGAIPEGFDANRDFVDETELEVGSLAEKQDGVESSELKYELIDSDEVSEFVAEVRKIIEKPEYLAAFEYHFVGDLAMHAFDADVIGPEVVVIFSATILLFFVILFFLFRRLSALVWSLVGVLSAVVWLMGTMGWVGTVMSELINPLILLTLVVGILDAVHIISGYMFNRGEGKNHITALRQVMRKSGVACFLTTLTTMVGFLSLAIVPLVELRVFGIYAAVGVAWAFVIDVLILPVMLDLWSPQPAATSTNRRFSWVQGLLERVNLIALNYPKTIVLVTVVGLAIVLPGIAKITVDTNPLKSLKEGTTVRHDAEVMEKALTGTQAMNLMIDAGTSNAFTDLRMLTAMQEMEDYIVNHPSQLAVTAGSILIGLKNSHRAINGGDLSNYRLPEDEHLAQQLLFLFQNAHPVANRRLVSDDYSKAHIQITLRNRGTADYVPLMKDIKSAHQRIFSPLKDDYPELDVRLTGSIAILMEMYDRMSWAQIESFGLALTIISIVLLLLFGSWRIGMLAMIPNLIPLAVVFGLMGWFGIPLDIVVLIVAPIIIGIVVDDTIHFFNHYRDEVSQTGKVRESVSSTIREVGQAITFTSLTLGIGLLCMMYSSHMGFTYLGLLGAIAIFTGLLCDLFLLPALCVLTEPRQFNRRTVPTMAT